MLNYTEVIELIKSKDSKSLELLYNYYGKKFYTYSIKNWELSEDDAWEAVYRTLETLILKLADYDFQSKAHFENFLLKVFVNFLRQTFRSKRNKEEREMEYMDLSNEEEIPEVITKQLSKEAFDTFYITDVKDNPALIVLNNVLKDMEPLDRDILLLRAQNYSYDEIAAFLEIDNNQLKVKHHRAKSKLINKLKEVQN